MRATTIFIVLCTGALLSSCGGGGGGGSDGGDDAGLEREDDSNPANLVYDSELSESERHALDVSTTTMGALTLDGGRVKAFSNVFGGNSSSNVVRYFERRVNYALSESTDIDGRIVDDPAEPIPPGAHSAELVARNLGTGLWVGSLVQDSGTVDFMINGKVIAITSSRVGIMQFGDVFARRDPIQQINTLVHEARHSDCTGGLRAEDLAQLRDGSLPDNKKCGHFHVPCPVGHPLEGELACDSHPWGAYAVGAIYSLAVASSCSSCTGPEKTVAEQEALDSLSRLLFDPVEMVDGKFGPADMSSSNNVGN